MLRYILPFVFSTVFATFSNATLISEDLGVGAYTASGQYLGNSPDRAFDGNAGTNWNAGGFAGQWIEVDLGQSYAIESFNLTATQSPQGNTVHEIWLSSSAIQSDLSSATLAHTFSGYTDNYDILSTVLSSPLTAQYVQIRTTSSPSWVAWYDIQVYDNSRAIPEPATIGLFGLGLAGLGFTRRRKA